MSGKIKKEEKKGTKELELPTIWLVDGRFTNYTMLIVRTNVEHGVLVSERSEPLTNEYHWNRDSRACGYIYRCNSYNPIPQDLAGIYILQKRGRNPRFVGSMFAKSQGIEL